MSRHTGCICFAQQYRNNVIQGSLTILCIFSLAKLVAHAKVATAQKNTEGRTSACYVLAPLQRTTCQIQAKRTIVIARLVSTNEWFPRLLRVSQNVINHPGSGEPNNLINVNVTANQRSAVTTVTPRPHSDHRETVTRYE